MRAQKVQTLSTETGMAPLDAALPTLRLLGTHGFIFVHNLGMRGPEFFHSEYPKAWQHEYETRNYTWADPVLLWSMLWTGDRRWSEIRSPDPMGVMAAARRFDLNFGAILCRWTGPRKSVMSLARADREFTDEEMVLLGATIDHLVHEARLDGSLTRVEVETLRCLREGLSHKEIADTLGISVSTVKLRIEKSRQKLGARSNTQALAIAISRNLV